MPRRQMPPAVVRFRQVGTGVLIGALVGAGCTVPPQQSEIWTAPKTLSATEVQQIILKCRKRRNVQLRNLCLEARGFKFDRHRTSKENVSEETANFSNGIPVGAVWYVPPQNMNRLKALTVIEECQKEALTIKRARGMSVEEHDNKANELLGKCLRLFRFQVLKQKDGQTVTRRLP